MKKTKNPFIGEIKTTIQGGSKFKTLRGYENFAHELLGIKFDCEVQMKLFNA